MSPLHAMLPSQPFISPFCDFSGGYWKGADRPPRALTMQGRQDAARKRGSDSSRYPSVEHLKNRATRSGTYDKGLRRIGQ